MKPSIWVVLAVVVVAGIAGIVVRSHNWKLAHETTMVHRMGASNTSIVQLPVGKFRFEIDAPTEVTTMVIPLSQFASGAKTSTSECVTSHQRRVRTECDIPTDRALLIKVDDERLNGEVKIALRIYEKIPANN